MYEETMLSNEALLQLARASRIALDGDEVKTFCRDLNAMLTMCSVLLPLESLDQRAHGTVGLDGLREDCVIPTVTDASTFAVPTAMEGEE